MVVDLVVKSYPADYEWMHFALRSIQKFATGFRDVLVMVPEDHGLNLTRERILTVPGPENYKYQQVCKLSVDMRSDADGFVYLDSDSVFTKPVTPELFFPDGKALWLMTPWTSLSGDEKRTWFHVIAHCLQDATPYEFMRRITIAAPRWAYPAFRDFIKKTHGIEYDSYIMNRPGNEFSEFNCLGAYLWLHHRDKIHWHDTSTMGVPEDWVKQHWSYAGVDNVVRNQMAMLLA